jgi:hypothetical protein
MEGGAAGQRGSKELLPRDLLSFRHHVLRRYAPAENLAIAIDPQVKADVTDVELERVMAQR